MIPSFSHLGEPTKAVAKRMDISKDEAERGMKEMSVKLKELGEQIYVALREDSPK